MRKSQGVPGDRGPFMGWGSLLGSSGIAEPEGTHFGGGLWGSFGGGHPNMRVLGDRMRGGPPGWGSQSCLGGGHGPQG